MRLIRLKLKNIASLKGDHEIDFQEIQRGSALFAITGETGSGKSSVLNSIGLALYGQIYKKNVNQLDVVTLGEKDGSIELIFQVKGKYYLADWRARVRKQNGELYSTPQTPSRNLYTLEGSDFNSPKNIATISCPELLNLDFDQFCKCIILNQGEFAKFLTSSFTDRKDILEKLYPGELLESIGRELKLELDTLHATKYEVEIKLSELRGDNLSGDLLKEQKKELESKLKEFESVSKNIEKLDYHFVSLCSYHDKFSENERKKELIKKDMAVETTKYNHILKNGETILERFQKATQEQEKELPLLQTYLKKEETLKLLEEGWHNHKRKTEELLKSIQFLDQRLQAKAEEEKEQKEKLSQLQSVLTLPLIDLKNARPHFENLFELFTEKELLQEELKGKLERLSLLETNGKEIKKTTEELEVKLAEIPSNIKDLVKVIEKKKSDLTLQSDKKHRAEIKSQELKKHIESSHIEIKNLDQKLEALKLLVKRTQEELFPLETTLKLQEVLNASEICVDHALNTKAQTCPVCAQETSPSLWAPLREKLAQTDLKSIREKFDGGTKVLFNGQKDLEFYTLKLEAEKKNQSQKEQEYSELEAERSTLLPTNLELDSELDQMRKKSWDFDSLAKDLESKKIELIKVREQYIKIKSETTLLEKSFLDKELKLTHFGEILKTVIKKINRETIRDLKLEAKNLSLFLDCEGALDKILHEKTYLDEQKNKTSLEVQNYQKEETEQIAKISVLKTELDSALNGQKASDLILKINQAAKLATDEWNRQVEEQKKQELVLKDSQGRLYSLDELTKDFDLQFTKELHAVKEQAAHNPKPELKKLAGLSFDFATPSEMFLPLKDLILEEKETYKNLTNECRMNFASVATRLSEWEKLQDKIQLLELKEKDVNFALARKMRLFEVLGKDELRTFVLSLVEENLILQTNDELQKLCQGRYEIVHQTRSLKMTPEFFIHDKFREGGRRKVSTLSGGETFMVSLAMALGLAEMTRWDPLESTCRHASLSIL